MKKFLIVCIASAIALAAVPTAASAVDIGPYSISAKDMVGRGPYVPYKGPRDATPLDFRKYFFRLTGARLGPCIQTGKEDISTLQYGSMDRKTCTAWRIEKGHGRFKTGGIAVLEPRTKYPSLAAYLAARNK